MNTTLIRPRPAPLPTTIDNWTRFLEREPTLNDKVEDIHRALWDEDAKYRSFLEAVWDSDAVEGSLSINNTMAAAILRAKAKENESPVADKKLDTIVKALNVVLKRYHASRKERRQTVAGEHVPNGDNGNGDHS